MDEIKTKNLKEDKTSDNKNKSIYIIVILGVIIIGIIYLFINSKPAKKGNALSFQLSNPVTPLPTEISKEVLENEQDGKGVLEMTIEDIQIGTGNEAVAGKKITVNYVGTLVDGTKFDSSYDRSEPFTFNLGAGQVILGWEQGFEGMKVGGKRKLTIPPNLGYGSRPMGTIPPYSTLIFEVELLKVE